MAIVSKVLNFVAGLKPVTMCTLMKELLSANSVGRVLHISGMLVEVYANAFTSARTLITLVVECLTSIVLQKMFSYQTDTSSTSTDVQDGSVPSTSTAPQKPDLSGFETPTVGPKEPTLLDDMREIADGITKTRLVQRISGILKFAWDMSKDLVAVCGGVFLGFASLVGVLCPGVKPARQVLMKFLDTVKLSKAAKYASETSIIDFDEFSEAVTKIVAAKGLSEPWLSLHLDAEQLTDMYKKDALRFATDDTSFHKLRETHKALSEVSMKALPNQVADVLKADFKNIVTLVAHTNKVKMATGDRVKPVCIVLAGQPGVGKSTLIGRMVEKVNKHFGVSGIDAWTCGCDHQDSLSGKPVMIMDEFGLVDLRKDTADLQRIVDTAPFHPNADMLENKQLFVAPRVVIVCTNHENIYNKSPFPAALARRITHHMLMTNDELMKVKKNRPGVNLSDDELTQHFKNHPSQLWNLPSCAVDWNGACFLPDLSIGSGPLTATDFDTLIAEVMKEVRTRDANYKQKTPIYYQTKPTDRGIFAFFGAPGTGKTTLALTIKDVVVYDDPQCDATMMDTFIADVMDDKKQHKVLLCANLETFDKVLKAKSIELHAAIFRRFVNVWDFTFNKSGYIYGHYTPKDVKKVGWAKVVSIKCGGRDVDNGHPAKTIKEYKAEPKFDYRLPKPIPDAITVLATIDCDLEDIDQITMSNVMSKVQLNLSAVKTSEVLRLMSDIGPRSQGKMTSAESCCRSVNCRKIMADLPLGLIKLNNITFQVVDSSPIQITIYTPPVATPNDLTNYNPWEGIDKESIVSALWSCFGTMIGFLGIMMTPKDGFQSDDAYDAGLRGVRKGRFLKQKAPAGFPVWDDSEIDHDPEIWAGSEQVDYTEKIIFETNVAKYIYPASDASGERIAWVLSTTNGLIMNRHGIGTCKRIGASPLGECTVRGIKKTDIAYVSPANAKGLSRMSCGFGVPIMGETVYRVGADGTEVPYVVVTKRMVPSPDNRCILMYLLSGPRTVSGDCGLPYIRRFKTSVELVGVHSGVNGDYIMCSPLLLPPEYQVGAGEGKTFLHKTQFVGINDSKWLPACKKSTDDNLDRNDIIMMNASPFFAVVKDKLLDVDYEQSVIDSCEYMQNLVPEWTKWSWRAALRSLDFSTSAGPSYKTTKQEVFNSDFDPIDKFQATFFRDLKTITSKCEIVIKDEMRKLSKIETCSSRLIFSFDVGQVVQAKQYLGSIQKQLIESVGNHYSAVGVSYMAGTWGVIGDNLQRYSHLIDADFAAWDKSMSRCMMDQVIRVFTAPISDREERERAMVLLRALSSAETQFGRTRQGLPSGMPCTSHLNSCAHLIMVNAAMASAGYGSYGADERVWFTSYGDDFVCGMQEPGFAQHLITVWRMFGFNATNSQKTGPPALVSHDEIQFLKRRFVKNDDGLWVAPLEKDSIEKSLRFTRSPVPYICDGVMQEHILMGDAQYARLQIAFTEAWQHGRDYYNDLKHRVITCAKEKKFRLAYCIPTFERFRVRIDPICTSENQLCVNSVNNPVVVQFQVKETNSIMSDAANTASSSNIETMNGQDNLVGGVVPTPTDLAGPTVGLEHAMGTTGGTSIIDPAIKERWAPVPGGAFSISNLTTVGTVVWQGRVHPDLNQFTSYIKELYNAWGGGFELQIFLGANNFIGGKLGLFFIPPGIDVTKLSTDDLLSFPKTIIDVRTCDMMCFNASDIKSVTWHQVGDDSVHGYGGTLVLAVITNIVSSGAENITIDGRIMSRPGPEFDFAFLKTGRVNAGGDSGAGTYMQMLGSVMSGPSATVVDQAPSLDVVIMPRMTAPVNQLNSRTLVRPTGVDAAGSFKLALPKHTKLQAEIGALDGQRRLVVFRNLEGEIYAPYPPNFGIGSRTLPPEWVGTGYAREVFVQFMTGAERNTKLTTIDRNANGIYITQTEDLPPEGTKVILGLTSIPELVDPFEPGFEWTPPNGESVIVWTCFDSADPVPSLQTLQTQALFVRTPHDTNGNCVLFNIIDNGNLTGMQAKLYPNGVTTSAGSASALVFSGSPTFVVVGLVGQDYRLPSVSEGAYLRSQTNLHLVKLMRCLLPSLELSEGGSLEARSLLGLLESQPRTTSTSNTATKPSKGSYSTGERKLLVTLGSEKARHTYLPGTLEQDQHP